MNELTYSNNITTKRGDVVRVPELSMLTHDKWGGAIIIGRLIEKGVAVVLDEYKLRIEPDDPYNAAKYAGPCMAAMIMRHQHDQLQPLST